LTISSAHSVPLVGVFSSGPPDAAAIINHQCRTTRIRQHAHCNISVGLQKYISTGNILRRQEKETVKLSLMSYSYCHSAIP
jgi:hypothetical protein